MPVDIESVFEALNQAKVKYLVVGGVAVVLHGHLRTTGDLDLMVELSRENAQHAMDALSRLGFRPRAPVAAADFSDPNIRRTWIQEKGLTVFSLWHPASPLEVDLFVEEPFSFTEVYGRALRVPLERSYAMLISKDDLIARKRTANRIQDHADIEALQHLDEDDQE